MSMRNGRSRPASVASSRRGGGKSVKGDESERDSLDVLCDRLVDGTDPVDVDAEQVADIIDRLKARKAELLRGSDDDMFDYDTLQRIDDVINQLSSSNEHLLYTDVQREEIEKLVRRRDEMQRQLADSEAQLVAVKKIFEGKRQDDIARLMQEQQRELEELNERYAQEPPAKYRKLSTELIHLRKHERMLRLTGRYMEAKQVRSDADGLEAFEMEKHRIKWEKDAQAARQDLMRKHKHQMDCLNEKWNRQWQTIEPDSIKEQQHCKKVIETYEKRIEEIMNSRNDFRGSTTRSVLKAKKERLPHLTSRPTSHLSSQRKTGRKTPGRGTRTGISGRGLR